MPIINAVMSSWLKGQIYKSDANLSVYAIFSNFSSKQISNRSVSTDITYGSPYGKIWDIGDTTWQIDFSCPILVTEQGTNISGTKYNSFSIIDDLLTTMLSVNGFKSGDAFTTNTLKDKWDFSPFTETISSNNADYIIQKLSIDISDSDASFSVSLLSTMDLRQYFKISSNISDSPFADLKVYRLAKPYDIEIPSDCIGAPFGFQQATEKKWPTFTANSKDYSSLLKEFHLTVENDTIQTPTIGMPTSRTFLGINSLKCSGNIKYIPLFFQGTNIIFQDTAANFAPAGWTVDMMAIDYITNSQRHGGKLYVSMDMVNPIYVQAKIKNSTNYIVNGKDADTPLGPVSTSSWGLSAGDINTIDVQFVTSPGILTF